MRILHKVLLANAAVIVPVVALAAALTHRAVEGGFLTYVRDLEYARLRPAQDRLARAYAARGDWEEVRAHPERWGAYLRREADRDRGAGEATPDASVAEDPPRGPPPPDSCDDDDRRPPPREARDDDPNGPRPGRPGPRRRGPPHPSSGAHRDPLEIPPRAVLFDAMRHRVVGAEVDPGAVPLMPIQVNDRTVGYLGLRPIDRLAALLDLDYLTSARRGLASMAALGLALALLASFFLARHVLAPIRRLTDGTARLRAQDFDVAVAIDSSDEFGSLGRDFNALAHALAESRRLQRSWLAEASHELRTPLAVLRAMVEALEDGVRPPSAETFASMRKQIATLATLVNDVHDLAKLDARGPELKLRRIDPIGVLRRVFDDFAERFAGSRLDATLIAPSDEVFVTGDEARLAQLFTNLFENARRYTDPGGPVRAIVTAQTDAVRIIVEDGPPGVSTEHLPHIFRPFHREGAAARRTEAGSGLGLTICSRIVAAHGGTIDASPSDLGGLRLEITLRRS